MTSRLIATIVAWLVGLLGVASPTAAASPDALAATYACNVPVFSAEVTGSVTERGPPAKTYDHTALRSAVDRSSRGSSARPELGPTWNDSAYDQTVQRAQSAIAGVTTLTASGSGVADVRVVPGAGVAAKAVPETLNFGSRAAAREGLPGDLAAVGNRFFRGATGKSQDFQAVGLPGGGYRLQFFSPADNPGYGKLYVQEIDRGGNIVSRYKDTIGPDGFIERKFVQ